LQPVFYIFSVRGSESEKGILCTHARICWALKIVTARDMERRTRVARLFLLCYIYFLSSSQTPGNLAMILFVTFEKLSGAKEIP
jgi:hypothetical protein